MKCVSAGCWVALGLLLLGGLQPGWAQTSAVRGEVVDSAGTPVAYARVVLRQARTGVLSDTLGRFALPAPAAADTLAISAIGYAPYQQAWKPGQPVGRIALRSQALVLPEVPIEAQTATRDWLGPDREGSMFWLNLQPNDPQDTTNHQGYEVAMTYRKRDGGWVRTVRLYVGTNTFGPCRLRLRFYAVARGKPASEVPAPEITFALADGQTGWITVPLQDQPVAVPEAFAVGIEWLSYRHSGKHRRPSISLPAATGLDNRVFRRQLGRDWVAESLPAVISLQVEIFQ